VADCIDFLGFRHDVEAIYASARVFVLTSESEGLPITMLEAMATGVPPVVPDVGEIGSVVRDGDSGFLFPAGDIQTLVERIETLLGDESLRHALGAAAARRVHEAASVEVVSREYRDLLSSGADPSAP
jgi:glycosyltransferase involved in cell wall biosynthesis